MSIFGLNLSLYLDMATVRLAYQPGFQSLIKGMSSESDFKLKGRFRMLFAGYVLVPSVCLSQFGK